MSGPVLAAPPTPYLVKDIKPGDETSFADFFTVHGGSAYFRADNGTNGFELWRTDGTANGTQMVTDIKAGPGNGFPINLASAGGYLYFTANDEETGAKVWRTDGTAAGTVMLKDVSPGADWGGFFSPPQPEYFTEAAGTVFFRAHDPTFGQELWKTDGTGDGTVRVKDIHPGSEWSVPVGLAPLGGKLFFTADDSFIDHGDGTVTYDRELWVSDGTEAGTVRLMDINPGPQPSIPGRYTLLGDALYFTADDGVSGMELWHTDGTAGGTALLKDVLPGPNGSGVEDLRALNGALYFTAFDGSTGIQLWRSDGTEAGTQLLKQINPSGDSFARDFTPVADGRFIFSADDGTHGTELWVSDGTEGGTQLLKDIAAGPANSAPLFVTGMNDELAFFVTVENLEDFTVLSQLWMTDGTEEGTQMVFQAPGKDWGYSITNLTVLGDRLLFMAPTGTDVDGFAINHELHALTIPEPAGVALAAVGGLLLLRRRRGM